MNTQRQEAQRAAFEKWDQDRFEIDVAHYVKIRGRYVDQPIQNRWETWQAASSPPAPTGEGVDLHVCTMPDESIYFTTGNPEAEVGETPARIDTVRLPTPAVKLILDHLPEYD